ncbi:MAG: HpcH/HpaI aldolase/citrate lyase family protein [Acidimicrobiia bacterium]
MRLRSVLFAPAVRPELIEKLPRAQADAVVIDCEDATPPGSKAAGRANAYEFGGRLATDGMSVFIRINAVGSPWFADDVREGVPPGAAGVVLPMVESSDQLDELASVLAREDRPALAVIAGLETAAGVDQARTLLAHPVVTAGYFGAEDFIADMGGVRTETNTEVLLARSLVAIAGRLAQVPVLDQVVVAYRDDERFRREAREARSMGYAGKMCIHPAQVAIAHEVFTPSPEEVESARRLIEAHEAAEREGRSVVVVDGKMIDGPLVAQAKKVIASTEN